MIQTITNSFKIFRNSKNKNFVLLFMFSIFCFLFLLSKYHLDKESAINTLLNNIFQFSGIFSALLITFIISKIFQIRQEKLLRLKEIISISNRTTDFRRICKILIDEYDFWNITMRRKLDNNYKKLSYFHLYLEIPKSEQIKNLEEVYLADNDKPGADFFLAVRSLLAGPKRFFELELYDDYDHNTTYPLKLIEKWHGADSANCFWYFLEYKWHNYNTVFNFDALSQDDKNQIVLLARKINLKKYESSVFSKNLLVLIGNDFQRNLFPRLYTLTYYNEQGIPETLIFLIRVLILIIIFGVFIPLRLSSIIIQNLNLKILISNICIFVLSLSIVYFVYNFKRILENEIKITQENI